MFDSWAEILDATKRHVGQLIEADELVTVDIAVHRTKPNTTESADGQRYPSHKRRLRVTAESLRAPRAPDDRTAATFKPTEEAGGDHRILLSANMKKAVGGNRRPNHTLSAKAVRG